MGSRRVGGCAGDGCADASAVDPQLRVPLVYDCNRPPEAQSAIPEKSEIYDIPGNTQLSPAQRQERIERVYRPFEAALRAQIDMHRATR